jgi:tight adherence protein C
MELLLTSFCALTMVAAGGILLLFSARGAQASVLNHRLHDYVDQVGLDAKSAESLLLSRPRELSGTFHARILNPLFRGLTRILSSLTPASTLKQLEEQLALAGNPFGMRAREFYGLQVGFMALGLGMAYLLLRNGLAGNGSDGSNPLLSAGAAALTVSICYYLPKSWLRNRAGRRRESIAKGLPDALDMLSVCVEAGLGFDQALQRVSEHWKTPLGAEFGRVVAEVGMGIPRREALRNLVDRVGSQEIASFVAVILQSDQLGMSIKDTLHAQAEMMRVERRFRAQEMARKMPLKMLFPLTLLIFPAIFAVVLGPSVPVLIEFFATLNSGP